MSSNRTLTFAFLALYALSGPAAGQTVSLVHDIETRARGTSDSMPAEMVEIGDRLFFSAILDAQARYTLVVYDTRSGTSTSPGRELTQVNSLVAFGAEVCYYAFRETDQKWYLCASDGTAAGTRTILGLSPQDLGSLVVCRQRLYFARADATHGRELWWFDGVRTGFYDINPGPASSEPVWLTAAADTLFFAADDGTHGLEPWRSDGTASGTVLLRDIHPSGGSVASLIIGFVDPTTKRASVLFNAADGKVGRELWISDGTTQGTRLLKDINPGPGDSLSWQARFDPATGQVFFRGSDATVGHALWVTDLTGPGTRMVKDIDPGTSAPFFVIGARDGRAFLIADDGTHGLELWVSDGTAAGTLLVDVWPGPPSGCDLNCTPRLLPGKTPRVVFGGRGPDTGTEPWISDGTPAGTFMLRDIVPGELSSEPDEVAPRTNGEFVFRASDRLLGFEPWISDGTAQNTRLMADINTQPPQFGSATQDSDPRGAVSMLDAVYFVAGSSAGDRLWRSDGQTAADVPWFTGDARPEQVTQVGDMVMFTVMHNGVRKLGVSHGSRSPLIIDVVDPRHLTAVGNTLFFASTDPNLGVELWRSDGTVAGTSMVADIQTGAGSSAPRDLVAFGDKLLFVAHHGAYGEELWSSDGTAAGTVLVKDILPGRARSAPQRLTVIGATLFFSAHDLSNGRELWKSDGTSAGTVLVKDIWPGTTGSSPAQFVPLGDVALFVAGEPATGRELWRTDGTAAGTVLVKDVYPGPNLSRIQEEYAAPGRVFFSARDDLHGQELWVSDGTSQGTQMVLDIALGDSHPRSFLASGSRYVWFSAETPAHGRELWRTDGSASGTAMVKDLIRGPLSSNPVPLGISEQPRVGGRLLFAADDWVVGRELFSVTLGASSRQLGRGCSEGRVPPTLTVADPTMGPFFTIVTFRGERVRPGSQAFALFSLGQAMPFLGCTLYVNFQFVSLGPFTAQGSTWQGSAVVPTLPSLVGHVVACQGLVFPAPGPRGFDLTNAAIVTVGR